MDKSTRGGSRPGAGRKPKQVSLSLVDLAASGLVVTQHMHDPAPDAWYVNGEGPYESLPLAVLAGVDRLSRLVSELTEELNRD